MKRLLKSASLVLAGVVLGWWLHDMTVTGTQIQNQIPTSSSAHQIVIPSPANGPDSPNAEAIRSGPILESNTPPDGARFRQLLSQQEFDQAIAYYEHALLFDGGYQQLLKPSLEAYLTACLLQCDDGIFVELVDLWLQTYYDDIPVLLLLAESQRLQGLPEEAASTLQLAATYALQAGQKEDVNAAVQGLVKSTDKHLSGQQSWIELLGFYEYLETIDLDTQAFALRQASLYQVLGESQRSRELLLALRESDNRLSSEWTEVLDRQLAKSAPDSAAGNPPMQAIPIARRGDHFLVATSINRVDQVILMIDTGASVTTLSKASFARVAGTDFEYRGSRLFNTANGLTQGEIYRAASISLGDTQIDDLDIAILDYESPDGVDGLLGMNVLRNYRFEIDQDEELLYLRPRR